MDDDRHIVPQIMSMNRAYVSLQQRVDRIAEKITHFEALEKSVAAAEKEKFDKITSRLLLFARRNAVQTFRLGHSELSKTYPILCPGNALRQVFLKTKASDCTLGEFRVLATAFSSNTEFRCRIFPSELYVKFSDPRSSSSFHILFDTYFDICQALQISMNQREEGVFRARKNSARQLKTVQVLGVDLLSTAENTPISRRILLGRGTPTSADDASVPMLFQSTTSWSENSWDVDFTYREETVRDIVRHANSIDTNEAALPIRSSDINELPPCRFLFRITWEKSSDSFQGRSGHAEDVPGTLRSFFPAVIIRTRMLAASSERILTSRVRGIYLKQIMSSPAQSQ